MELPQNCQTQSSNTSLFPVCKSDLACCYLPWPCLFVIVGRRSHRLRASVWGAAGGDHLPWGVARGKNHHELPCQSQSTCQIQVTYVPHKPILITTRCAFSVSCHSPSFRVFSYWLRSAFELQGHKDICLNLDAPPWFTTYVCDHPAVHYCVIYFQSIST